jgi:FKBP-type peptidyl-prolyl cis-trans isomerase
MKKTVLLIFTLSISLAIFSQTKKAVGAPTTKPPIASSTPKVPTTKPPVVLKTATDSLSYAIGVLDGNFFKTQGLDKVSAAALGQGFGDVMKGKTIFTPEQADQIVRAELQKNSRKKIQPVIDEGNKFLAENAKKPGVKKTSSGLQYEVLVQGNGPKPADTSVVKVHYSGFLLNGKKFDSSVDRGEPATFPLGNVIRGWTEGVQLMPVGSKFKFYIPYQLGYGEQGSGETIPGGSTLIFEVELLEIVTNK